MAARRGRKKTGKARPVAPPTHALDLALEALEVTCGSDGLFRGKPEPALVVGVFRTVAGQRTSLVGRLLARARPTGGFPVRFPFSGVELRYDTRFSSDEHVVVVVAAIEEDDGTGVTALYGGLGVPPRLLVYRSEELVPAPGGVGGLALQTFLAPAATPLELLLDERHARDHALGDDYVAASGFAVPVGEGTDDTWRLGFVDPDGQNDWTLVLRLRVAV